MIVHAAHTATHLTATQRAANQHAQLVKQTQKWVAQTFFGTMLKQMRDDPFKSDLMDGGRGGQMFGQMYDQELADRMGRSAGQKLVNSIVRKIEANKAYKAAAKPGSKSPAPSTAHAGESSVEPARAARVAASAALADAAYRGRR